MPANEPTEANVELINGLPDNRLLDKTALEDPVDATPLEARARLTLAQVKPPETSVDTPTQQPDRPSRQMN